MPFRRCTARLSAVLLTAALLTALTAVPAAAGAKYSGAFQSKAGGAKVTAKLYRSGKYRLTVSGKTLTVGKIKSGAKLKKASWKKKKSQLWTVKKRSGGGVSFISCANKNYALSATKKGLFLKKKRAEASQVFKKVAAKKAAAGGAVTNAKDGAAQHGWLSVKGTQLVDASGRPVVLHGMSSHGLQWFGNFASSGAIGATASYGANLFRAAMYTAENGYLSDKTGMYAKLCAAVDAAVSRNMYVIIDWHILSDANPRSHQGEAKAFFKKVSARYAGTPNVLYEICNEPNGGTSWKDVKTYAEAVIPVIRNNSPRSVILVGTPTWSQDVDLAAADPLSFGNIMYVCHFYAGTHFAFLREKVSTALSKGAPIFVTEWGTSDASGNGGVFTKEAATWLSFLAQHKISWANWSLCDKSESSAALKPGANADDGISSSELSASGKFVFARF